MPKFKNRLTSRESVLVQSAAYKAKTSNSLLNYCIFLLNPKIDLEFDCN